jgi:iron(III) transport system permease protein
MAEVRGTVLADFSDGDSRPLFRIAWTVVFFLSVTPVFLLSVAAFMPEGHFAPGTALAELLRPSVARAAWNSLESSFLSALLALLIGGGAALALAATDMRGKTLVAFLLALSMLIAPHVAALAFKTMAGPASPLLKAVGLAPPPGTPNPLLGRVGVIMILGLHHAPLVMLTILAGLKSVPRSLVEAAEIDGAGHWRITRLVVLPSAASHCAAAGILAFVAALGNFGIPALLGLPANYVTLPTLIYRTLASFGPDAISRVAALSLLTCVMAGLALLVLALVPGRTVAPLDRDMALRPYWSLGRKRVFVESIMAALIGIALVLPILSLVAASLVPAYGMAFSLDNLTLRAFGEVLFRQTATREGFRTSLTIAAAAAFLLALFAVPLAYAMRRSGHRATGALDFLIDMPFSLPGVVIAISAILAALQIFPLLGINIYGTPWLILLAYSARFMTLAVRPVAAALDQIDPSIEEAAALCGAGLWRRIYHILMPALMPAMLAGGIFVFLTALNELTVSALLWGAGSRTLGVVLFGFEEAGLTPEASALGLITIGLVALLMLVINALSSKLPSGIIPWRVTTDSE